MGEVTQTMKVPLAYGKNKWLARLRRPQSYEKGCGYFACIGFEIANISYDPARKLNSIQKFKK